MDTEILKRYITGGLSREERNAVADWICADAEHLKEYKSLRRLYDISLWNVSGQNVLSHSRRRTGRIWLAAASVALLIGCGIGYLANRPNNSLPPLIPTSVTVPQGKDLELELADGSRVWLNAGSQLRFEADKKHKERTVYLDGEGYFAIEADRNKPFLVKTFGHTIKVTGTEFNVTARETDRIWEVALLKGSVSIINARGEEKATLQPGRKITLTGNKLIISPINEDDYLWKDGILYFDNLTLNEILMRLSSYYGVSFDTSGLKAGDKRYTGKFKSQLGYDHILKALQMINHDFSIDYPEGTEGGQIRIF